MPLIPTAVSAAIVAAGPDLRGTVWQRVCQALGVAVASWTTTPGNIVVAGVTSGTAGSGTVNGKLFVLPQPLPVSGAFSGASLLGVESPQVSKAVGVGVGNAFNAGALYQGISAGVGVGADVVSKVTANPTTLTAAIMAAGAATGLKGVNMPQLAGALGTGIASLISGASGAGTVTGAGGPAPAAGTSVSRVV
jgi:hypothetical protein